MFWWKDFPVGQELNEGEVGRSIQVTSLTGHCVDSEILELAKRITENEAADPGDNLFVSVVICTRDRPDGLLRCLASLGNQTRRPGEIVVVDNASHDGRTRSVVTTAGVKYIREDRPGLNFARNAGARAASGDVLIYTDDDLCLHPRWVQRMVAAFDTPQVKAVTGLVLPAELETPAQRHFEKFWSFGRGYRRIDYNSAFFSLDTTRGCPVWAIGTGASMAFRREIFERIGFFDERLDVGQAGCSGDSEYWHRVLSQGWTCRYEPAAVAFHYHRRDMAGLSRQIFYYMRGHSAALMVQYERTRNLGNLRRALLTMPWWYIKRLVHLLKARSENDLFLKQEIHGYLSGLKFYFSTPRHLKRASSVESSD